MTSRALMLLLFLSGILIAEDAMDLSRAIGFSGGMISGSGFSYRKLDHKGGFQINGGLLANNGNGSIMEDESVHDIYYWYPDTSHIYTEYDWDMSVSGSFGYNYYKTLRKAKNSTLYLLAGAALYFRSEKEISRDYQYAQIDSAKYRILYVTDEKIQWVHDGTFNLGAGFGIEYNITDHIRVSVDWPLVFSFSTDSDFQIFMYIPQGGIHYYFK